MDLELANNWLDDTAADEVGTVDGMGNEDWETAEDSITEDDDGTKNGLESAGEGGTSSQDWPLLFAISNWKTFPGKLGAGWTADMGENGETPD